MPPEGQPFGKYELLERLAAGGMAEIYRAHYRAAAGITKPVVIKKILANYAGNPAFVRMFMDEAKIVVGLSHGNIAQVFDFGEIDGEYFLAMELVHGQPLSKMMRRGREKGLPAVPSPFAVFIAMEMAKGLHYAHTRLDDQGRALGIVHRDVSPQNVILGYDGQVKLVDFGIAKARMAGRNETEVGALKGKYVYFAPEQARGKELDARTDVFAAGIVLYEMLCGRLPFEGKMMDVLTKIVRADFPRPRSLNPEIAPALERIVLTAMSLEKEDRYQSAQALQEALAGFLYAHAPTFSNGSLMHLLGYLYEEELGADGRTMVLPREFLEQVPLWKKALPGAAAASKGKSRSGAERGDRVTSLARTSRGGSHRSGRITLTSRPDEGAAVRTANGFRPRDWLREKLKPALARLQPNAARTGRGNGRGRGRAKWALVALPLAAAAMSAGIVLAVGNSGTFALELTTEPSGAQVILNGEPTEGVTPLRISRLPADQMHMVEVFVPGMKRVAHPVQPVRGETVPLHVVLDRAPVPQDLAHGADGAVHEVSWPLSQLQLLPRHHGFTVAPSKAARVRLDPKKTYVAWTEGASRGPLIYFLEGTDALPGDDTFGTLPEGGHTPHTLRGATALYVFDLRDAAHGTQDSTAGAVRVRIQERGQSEITTLSIEGALHGVVPSERERLTLDGLDSDATYELELRPGASPARIRPGAVGLVRRVLLFTSAQNASARILTVGQPLRLTGVTQVSFTLADDALEDNDGEMLIAITRRP